MLLNASSVSAINRSEDDPVQLNLCIHQPASSWAWKPVILPLLLSAITVDGSQKWNCEYLPLCGRFVSLNPVLRGHRCYNIRQYFIMCSAWVKFHYVCCHISCSLVCHGALKFSVVALVNDAQLGVSIALGDPDFSSFLKYSNVRLLGHLSILFLFWKMFIMPCLVRVPFCVTSHGAQRPSLFNTLLTRWFAF